MSVKLVTCLYNGLNRSILCGRLNRDKPYNYSLEAISKTNADIVCYTSPSELSDLEHHFTSDLNVKNISFLPHDLYSFPFHPRVNAIRDAEASTYRDAPDWRDRCVEIMWGKFIFIQNVIQNNSDLDHVYWIDAGISHSGIIHSRFNSHYEHNINFVWDLDKDTYPNTFKHDLIFNDTFMADLIRYTGEGNMLNIVAKGPQHPVLPSDHPFKGSVIGGIFGGRIDIMNAYCGKVIELYEKFLDKGVLHKEEQLMTFILSAGYFPTKVFAFDSWYHPDWEGRFNSEEQISFCNFFDEMRK